jgi:hypothetical protein
MIINPTVRVLGKMLGKFAGALLLAVIVGSTYYNSKVRPKMLRAHSIACRHNLKQIAVSVKLWMDDNPGHFPTNFAVLREEVGTFKVFICPSDKSNPMSRITNWNTFDQKLISYEMLSPVASEGAFARCKFHRHVCFVDGSVVEAYDSSAR